MVAVRTIAPMRRMTRPGIRPCDRRGVCLPSTASCGTSLRVNCSRTGRPTKGRPCGKMLTDNVSAICDYSGVEEYYALTALQTILAGWR